MNLPLRAHTDTSNYEILAVIWLVCLDGWIPSSGHRTLDGTEKNNERVRPSSGRRTLDGTDKNNERVRPPCGGCILVGHEVKHEFFKNVTNVTKEKNCRNN